jgi:hypothetical protein
MRRALIASGDPGALVAVYCRAPRHMTRTFLSGQVPTKWPSSMSKQLGQAYHKVPGARSMDLQNIGVIRFSCTRVLTALLPGTNCECAGFFAAGGEIGVPVWMRISGTSSASMKCGVGLGVLFLNGF